MALLDWLHDLLPQTAELQQNGNTRPLQLPPAAAVNPNEYWRTRNAWEQANIRQEQYEQKWRVKK